MGYPVTVQRLDRQELVVRSAKLDRLTTDEGGRSPLLALDFDAPLQPRFPSRRRWR
jgi:hypothetical protein